MGASAQGRLSPSHGGTAAAAPAPVQVDPNTNDSRRARGSARGRPGPCTHRRHAPARPGSDHAAHRAVSLVLIATGRNSTAMGPLCIPGRGIGVPTPAGSRRAAGPDGTRTDAEVSPSPTRIFWSARARPSVPSPSRRCGRPAALRVRAGLLSEPAVRVSIGDSNTATHSNTRARPPRRQVRDEGPARRQHPHIQPRLAVGAGRGGSARTREKVV